MSRLCPQGHEISGNNAKPVTKRGKQYTTCRQCGSDRTRKSRMENGNSLPSTTKSIMASYKEPLRPVNQGFGYYGTISYDESEVYTQCHLCGNFYKTLGIHIHQTHDKTVRQYKIEMGLPLALSLTAPKRKNKNYEQWINYTPEQRKEAIRKLSAGRENRRMPNDFRKRTLYNKNKEGRCPDQLLDKILQLKEKTGIVPSKREFLREYEGKFMGSINLTFGGWGEAIKILGLTERKGGNPTHMQYDRELLIALMFEFRERYGREPMSTDTGRGLLPSKGTFRRHFGSWGNAKEYVIKGGV